MAEDSRALTSRTFAALLLAVLCGQLQGCSSSSNRPVWPPESVKWPLDRAGTRTLTIRIAPGYSIGPAADAMAHLMYPKGEPKSNNPLQPAQELLLETLWPEMGPHMYANDKAFDVPGGGRVLSILIDSDAVDSAAHRWDRLHMHLRGDLMFSRMLCYPHYPGNAICHNQKQLSRKPNRYGLKHRGVDFNRFKDIPKQDYRMFDDVFYANGLGSNLKLYITCTPFEAKPGIMLVPQCNENFVYKPWNALVSVHYRRVYLRNWRAIQYKVEGLLASFAISGRQERDRGSRF